MFLADTDRRNIQELGGLIEREHGAVPDIWRDSSGYYDFIDRPEGGIVLIRIDDCAIPGLELTQAAIASGGSVHVVWMAQSDSYAVEAFRYGAEAYLLLPATRETLREVIRSLNTPTKENQDQGRR